MILSFNQVLIHSHHIKCVFDTQVDQATINQKLVLIAQRKIDHGYYIKYEKKTLQVAQ